MTDFVSSDPLPPEVTDRTHNSFFVSWLPAKFCGIVPPQSLDTVTYTLEVAEGVEYKQNFATKYMSDLTATNYRKVCSGSNIFSARINDLKPACWYHFRLVVEYMGRQLRVMSETRSAHTLCSVPSVPGSPNIYVIPVPSSFDLLSDAPARLEVLICWSPSVGNGHPISKYQVQLCRIDVHGNYILSEETQKRKKQRSTLLHSDAVMNSLLKGNRSANQWVKSPGKSVVQIQNSLNTRSKSAQSKRLPGSSSPVPGAASPLHHDDSFVSFPALSESSKLEGGGSSLSTALKWSVVYENLNRSVKLPSPGKQETEWHVRVRAKNSLGWSAYTETLRVGSYTHPTLFRGVPVFDLVPPASPKANMRLSRSVDFTALKSMSSAHGNGNLLLGVTEEEFMNCDSTEHLSVDSRHFGGGISTESSQVRFEPTRDHASGLSPLRTSYGGYEQPESDHQTPQHQPFSPSAQQHAGFHSNHYSESSARDRAAQQHAQRHVSHSQAVDEDDLNPHLSSPAHGLRPGQSLSPMTQSHAHSSPHLVRGGPAGGHLPSIRSSV